MGSGVYSNLITKKTDPLHRVKAIWRGTALVLLIRASSEDEAMSKAAKQVLRMEGGVRCLEIVYLGPVN